MSNSFQEDIGKILTSSMTEKRNLIPVLYDFMNTYIKVEEIRDMCEGVLNDINFDLNLVGQEKIETIAGGYLYNQWVPQKLVNRNTDHDLYIPLPAVSNITERMNWYKSRISACMENLEDRAMISKSDIPAIEIFLRTFDSGYNANPYVAGTLTLNHYPIPTKSTQLIFYFEDAMSNLAPGLPAIYGLLKSFDFYHCATAYHRGKVYTSPLAFFTAVAGLLVMQNGGNYNSNRFQRFMERGFKLWEMDDNYEFMKEAFQEYLNEPSQV